MKDTLRKLRAKRADGDRGFTLIELLVVVVIIGVLVAIAIPVYLNYRKGAENRSAQSDVRSAITTIEQCYTDNSNAYPASVNSVGQTMTLSCGGTNETVNLSPNNTAAYTKVAGVGGAPDSYTIAVTQGDTHAVYTYDSSTGKIT